MYADEDYLPSSSLTREHSLQRMTLARFGFSTDDASLENYRGIFRAYIHSPYEYDAGVMASVIYMHENKLLYYRAPKSKWVKT